MSIIKKKIYENPIGYEFSPISKMIALIKKEHDEYCIYLSNINQDGTSLIWKGSNSVKKIIFDNSGSQISFAIDTTLWYYNLNSIEKPKELKISIKEDFIGFSNPQPEYFSEKNNLLFFKIKEQSPNLQYSKKVNNYSYLDGTFDMTSEPSPSYYTCCFDINSGSILRIEQEDENMNDISNDEKKILVSNRQGSPADYYWSKKSTLKDYLLYIETTEKKNIKTDAEKNILSPYGNFVIGNSNLSGDIICIDLDEGVTRNLTASLPIPLIDNINEALNTSKSRGLSFIKFLNNGKDILIKDQYDLWILNLKNGSHPINVTNGFGRKKNITFNVIENNFDYNKNRDSYKRIILSAFDNTTKKSGFYEIQLGEKKDPKLLSMGAFVYKEILKAKDKNIWIVKRMSATEAPNYFSTSNFKVFNALTDVRPEKKTSWFTTELLTYKTKNGVICNAILYKPDNFDSTKKYPVLFNFYEQESSKLNEYLLPDYTSHFYFNIPIMLDQGYIVCVPDIHFKIGETADNIVDCVEGAAKYISQFSFIDSNHMGASGGSFGGYGVNCLAAFSTQFKAVASISGVSDLISGYGSDPGLRDEIFENRQFRMGVSLSTDPERYLKNSPVVYAKKVNTPVLIVITKIDYNVSVQQGIEWFISLRREGKPSWLIRYMSEESQHGVWGENDQKDLYIRMNQLFDHYLKGLPAPKWMTEGISSKENRWNPGYDYNEKITSPPAGLLRDSI